MRRLDAQAADDVSRAVARHLDELGADPAALAALGPDGLRRHVRARVHLHTYLPFYILGLLLLASLALFPSLADDRAGDVALDAGDGGWQAGAGATGPTGAGVGGTAGDADATVVSSAPGARSGGAGGGGDAGPQAGGGGQAAGADAAPATGPMRDGRVCEPGVSQVEGSSYAGPCRPVFQGDNGGATYRGVSGDTIRIVRRTFPETANSQAVAAFAEQAGAASSDDVAVVRRAFLDYFNETFELYGRRVELVEYVSQHGNATNEAQSRGREGACLDAEQIVTELDAFAVAIGGGTSTFSECAAQRGLMVFGAAAYFPESFYRHYSPYLWDTTMNCERISNLTAEYIGKRLLNRPARWAGDPAYRTRERRFGVYVPNNDAYQRCTNNTQRMMTERYGAPESVRYNYTLDVSRFPDEAARAVVQFRQAGVTSLILACDPISVMFLTQSATAQQWRPEWILIGTALTDLENTARLYEQSQVDGSMFGQSQLGNPRDILGPDSEPGRLYHRITGQQIPDGTAGDYFALVQLFSMLQAAGPELTPENVRRGAFAMPERGAPNFPAGRWSFAVGVDGDPNGVSHTAVIDAREVYWDANAIAFDGERGAFIETYGGRRFTHGEWPEEEPPVYP